MPLARREIWIWIEPFPLRPPRWLGALLTMGQSLAERLDADPLILALGWGREEAARQLSYPGIKRIRWAQDPLLSPYLGNVYQQIFLSEMAKRTPVAVIVPATANGRDLTARLASRHPCWFTPRCTGIYPIDAGRIRVSRLVYGGQLERWLEVPLDRPLIASMQTNLLPMTNLSPVGKVAIDDMELPVLASTVKPLSVHRMESGSYSLGEAEIVVAGGAGAGDREGFRLIEDLADVLGGVVAGTQVAVEKGWIPRAHQIGRSGCSVSPDLFVACGISGSTHFVAGMENSGTIVAINIDPDAPIFRVADIMIVGDLREVIPVLTKKMRQRRS